MSNTAHVPPEDLVHDLTMSLWRERAALRDLARRKAWAAGDHEFRSAELTRTSPSSSSLPARNLALARAWIGFLWRR